MRASLKRGHDERMKTLLVVATLLGLGNATATTLTGKVVKVADGDTVTVLVGNEQRRVRLAGIDAPERKQPYGKASGRALRALVAGKQVRVDYDKRDRYGRIVGVVWVRAPDMQCASEPCPKTLDAGLYLVTVGLAWWYRRYAREQTLQQRAAYEKAERQARTEGAGLWRQPRPVAPWQWRRQRR